MKFFLKKIARNSGIFRISSWFNKDLLTIFAYHCLSTDHLASSLMHYDRKQITVAEFEDHLRMIIKYGHPISLEEAIVNKHLPSHPVVLTFDDGYKNNYNYAFPLLKKYQVPATIFITTGFIDRTNYIWPDQLEYIIDKAPADSPKFSWENDELSLEMDSAADKIRSIRRLKDYLKGLPESQKLSFIDKLQQVLNIDYDWSKIPEDLLPLSWDEIREMQKSNLISIGSHSVTHPILSHCTPEQQRKELALSQQRIREELKTAGNLFAYPNGKSTDYNQDTIELLKELQYSGAVTVVHGYVENNPRNNYQLNRFGGDISLEAVGTIVSGLSRIVGTI